MKIIVTGSLGTLGRPLVAELRRRGHAVTGVDLRHDGDPGHVRADVAVRHQLERAFDATEPDAVYHLAAEFGRHNGELFTEQLWRTAMVGTRNVLELCTAHDAHLIFASSSEIYGDYEPPDGVLHEDATDSIVMDHPNEYALSKWANERQVRAYRRRYSLDATVLRFFNAYGPGEAYHPFRSVVALFCHRALTGQTLPVYEGYWRTFMYADDFTPTLANVCTADRSWETYNIGGIDYRSVEDLARLVLANVPLDVRYSDQIERIPEDKHNTRSKRPDILRAQRDFGHDPATRLEEGVPPTIEWMAANMPTIGAPRA